VSDEACFANGDVPESKAPVLPIPSEFLDTSHQNGTETVVRSELHSDCALSSPGQNADDPIQNASSEEALATVYVPEEIPSLDLGSLSCGDSYQQLEQHRRECEKLGKYDEAEEAKNRLLQMREMDSARRKRELQELHLAQRLSAEELHMKDTQEFNDLWDRKMQELEENSESLKNALAQRHEQELHAYMEKLRQDIEPKHPRWSVELLNMRKVQETLAKLKKYSEAGKTKAKADQMEAMEAEEWQAKRDLKIAAFEEKFVQKQRLEMMGLIKRIESGKAERVQTRQTEFLRLVQRGQNTKKQLANTHKIVQQRSDKYPETANSSMRNSPRGRASPRPGRPVS